MRDFATEQPSTDILEVGDITLVMICEEGRIEYAISGKVAGDTIITLDLHALVNVTVNVTSTEPAPADERASTKLYFKITKVPCRFVF